MLWMINFFVLHKVIISNIICQYFRYYWIINCVNLELIIFAIDMNIELFFKVFNIFNYIFISIILLTLLNKFILFKRKISIFF